MSTSCCASRAGRVLRGRLRS
nr:hypothetical protein [Tanacetum cinerariifolium]